MSCMWRRVIKKYFGSREWLCYWAAGAMAPFNFRNSMLINLLQNHWIIVKGREPLLYTASKLPEIAVRKFENHEKCKWFSNCGFTLVNVDITVKDLNPE